MPEMDPRVMLAMTLVSLGLTTVEKLRETWQSHGIGEAELDEILSEVDRRLARRG